MPGSPSGGIDGIGLAALTTDFSDPMFAAQIVAEQAGALDKKIDRSGPAHTQALNRYSYVQNNPLKWTDPTGHTWKMTRYAAADLAIGLRDFAKELRGYIGGGNLATGAAEAIAILVASYARKYPIAASLLNGPIMANALNLLAIGAIGAIPAVDHAADVIDKIASLIESANSRGEGIELEYRDNTLIATNTEGGQYSLMNIPFWVDWSMPNSLRPGTIIEVKSSDDP